MKLYVRSNIYKAANVTFDPVKITASSYDWWIFVKKIKGNVVFNDYAYSITTRKHQNKVRSLMRELGINIDRTVAFKQSLDSVTTLTELKKLQAAQDKRNAEIAEQKRLERNKKAKRRRDVIKLVEKIFDEAAFRDYDFQSGWKENAVFCRVRTFWNDETITTEVQESVRRFIANGASSVRVRVQS